MHPKQIAQKPFTKGAGETKVFLLDCTDFLPPGATIASVNGSPAVTTLSGTSTTPLAVAGIDTNDVAIDYESACGTDTEVAIDKGIQATYSGGTAGCTYLVVFTWTNSEGETEQGGVRVEM